MPVSLRHLDSLHYLCPIEPRLRVALLPASAAEVQLVRAYLRDGADVTTDLDGQSFDVVLACWEGAPLDRAAAAGRPLVALCAGGASGPHSLAGALNAGADVALPQAVTVELLRAVAAAHDRARSSHPKPVTRPRPPSVVLDAPRRGEAGMRAEGWDVRGEDVGRVDEASVEVSHGAPHAIRERIL
jgi:hypothetical protein